MKVKVVVDDSKYQNATNTKFAQISKTKLKWKIIKWIIENKQENLDKLSNNRHILEKFTLIKEHSQKGMNKKEFGELMISNGITKDWDIINKLFWVFDEDGSGDIEYKELAFGLEMFRDSSIENKLKSK
jgi:Ca2+-binding EF-hand superfamily protein